MQQIDDNIWVHEDSMRLMGVTIGLRMTVVKLSSGKLWVHSPTELDQPLAEQIDALGEVAFLVGASNGHNLWLLQWSEQYPNAVLYVSEGIPQKLQLEHFVELDEASATIWEYDLQAAHMGGVPFLDETVFLHKSSNSLIVTDFIQNHPEETPKGMEGLFVKWLFQPLGFKGVCTAPPLKMRFMIKDKDALSEFLKKVQSWQFDRIIVTHGDIIDQNPTQVLQQLCDQL